VAGNCLVWCEANQTGGRSSSRVGSGIQLAKTQTRQGSVQNSSCSFRLLSFFLRSLATDVVTCTPDTISYSHRLDKNRKWPSLTIENESEKEYVPSRQIKL
jgi:hypothetical protein